jgi:uncharacterized membrane protein YsdA (DUF1294 family)
MKPEDSSHEKKERAKVVVLFVVIGLVTFAIFAWTCLKAWGADTTIVFAALLLFALVVGLMEGTCLAMIHFLGAGLIRLANWVRRRTR